MEKIVSYDYSFIREKLYGKIPTNTSIYIFIYNCNVTSNILQTIIILQFIIELFI
jgi:hypothetical protein